MGFSGVGILPASANLSHAFYQRWLEEGHGAEMAYLARHLDLKRHPTRLLPGLQTVVAVTYNYHHPPPSRPAGPRGRVSRYAWGEDYHNVIRDKLQSLAQFIATALDGPLNYRICVDSAPVMERETAARAGLGWVGKNACLIDGRAGSWLFLAELLLDRVLPYDPPLSPRKNQRKQAPPALALSAATTLALLESCGSCTACLEACPTGAIVANKTVDSRRCISYLTIELKSPIPVEYRPALGEWLFGCDICQEVCPWNRKAPDSTETAFAPAGTGAWPDLIGLLAMDAGQFKEAFRQSPLARPKRKGLLRNAAIVLGNLLRQPQGFSLEDHQRGLLALTQALADPEALIRGAAAWALGQSGDRAARNSLANRLPLEEDATVKEEVTEALREWKSQSEKR